MDKRGFSVIETIIVLVILVVIVVGGLIIYKHEDKASVTKSQTQSSQVAPVVNSAYAVLSPATVPSKTAECSQSITYASNGVPGPVQCSNGGLNSTDWSALAALEPSVLRLGYNASTSQVQTALCGDVSANISNSIELTVYQIASLYYGWNFSTNPSVVLTNGTCRNVDD